MGEPQTESYGVQDLKNQVLESGCKRWSLGWETLPGDRRQDMAQGFLGTEGQVWDFGVRVLVFVLQ